MADWASVHLNRFIWFENCFSVRFDGSHRLQRYGIYRRPGWQLTSGTTAECEPYKWPLKLIRGKIRNHRILMWVIFTRFPAFLRLSGICCSRRGESVQRQSQAPPSGLSFHRDREAEALLDRSICELVSGPFVETLRQ